jgi:hypothetical protein
MAHDHSTDSSGVPWEGRSFQPNPHAGDDGKTPPEVADALSAFRDGTGTFAQLANALADSRALIPLVTHAGDEFDADNPVMEDKIQELAVVTLEGPNGEKVYPAFTSAEAMRAWKSDARPIPIEFRRVALAAAGENVDRIVVNPSTDQIVLRRPAVWAIAQGETVVSPWESDALLANVREALATIEQVLDVSFESVDVRATGLGPELRLVVALVAGLDESTMKAVVSEIHSRATSSLVLTQATDSLEIALRSGSFGSPPN